MWPRRLPENPLRDRPVNPPNCNADALDAKEASARNEQRAAFSLTIPADSKACSAARIA